MNRYVKVKGHANWFLVLKPNTNEPEGLSETMQEKILRSEVCGLHDPEEKRSDVLFVHRLINIATREIDYEDKANKYGTILIRPIGSFMPLQGNEITEEKFSEDFPIDEFGDIVICENDKYPDQEWVNYLKIRFPDKKIVTINYFDLRSDSDVEKFFEKAEYITFSTTFSDFGWFKKLSKHVTDNHKVIGYSHDAGKWIEAHEINPRVEIIESMKL